MNARPFTKEEKERFEWELNGCSWPKPQHFHKKNRYLFFTCVLYDDPIPGESERLLALRGWPRQRRILFVRLLGWLNPRLRGWLGLR